MSIETVKNKELVCDLSIMLIKDRTFLENIYTRAPTKGLGYEVVTALLSDNPRESLEKMNPDYALVFDFVCEKYL